MSIKEFVQKFYKSDKPAYRQRNHGQRRGGQEQDSCLRECVIGRAGSVLRSEPGRMRWLGR